MADQMVFQLVMAGGTVSPDDPPCWPLASVWIPVVAARWDRVTAVLPLEVPVDWATAAAIAIDDGPPHTARRPSSRSSNHRRPPWNAT
ncbi:hypothetical protein, partial [Mycobacterium tilburgii]|uniref:hypothetical protein n=1 Tax=Mycobacterium tilburgii TaxID=44467 RepID=UPI0021B43C8D